MIFKMFKNLFKGRTDNKYCCYNSNDLSKAYDRGFKKGYKEGKRSWLKNIEPSEKVSKEEFKKQYLERYSLDSLREDQIIVKCNCDHPGCQGWIVSDELTEEFKRQNGLIN